MNELAGGPLSLDRSTRRILHGPLALEAARFGAPLALGMGLQTTFNLVDAYILSQLPKETASTALAAIGYCDMVIAATTIVSYGLSIATGAIISRRRGEGDEAGVRQVAWQSLLLISAISVAFGAFGLLGADALMARYGNHPDVHRVGADYMRVMMGGGGVMFLLLHLVTIQRALGSSKTPITLLVAANVLNLIFAVLFVYGPGPAPSFFSWSAPIAATLGIPRMEVVGAAWATVLARSIALAPLFLIVVLRFRLFRRSSRSAPDWRMLRTIWRIGWPTASQLVVRVAAIVIVLLVVGKAYTTETDHSAATALGIVLRLETMALFVGLGWGSASQTFVGQNLGAGNKRRAQLSGWYTAAYNCAMMVLFWWACVRWGGGFVRFFYDDQVVVQFAQEYINWVSPSYLGLGVGIVLGSAMQGAGATRLTLALDVVVVSLVQVPLCAVVLLGGLPPHRLWQAVAVTYIAFAIVYLYKYRRGSFLETELS